MIRSKVLGDIATDITREDRTIDIRLWVDEQYRDSAADLANLSISDTGTTAIPLSAVADVVEAEGPAEIRRSDGERVALITANLTGRDLGSATEEIVGNLSNVQATDIGGDRTPAECGLAPPQARVTIEFSEESGTKPLAILFGIKGPKGKRYYVVTGEEGARVFLVSSYYRYLAMRDLDELRKVKREIPPTEPAEQPATEPTESH